VESAEGVPILSITESGFPFGEIMLTRRSALQSALTFAFAGVPALASHERLRVGMMDVILGYPSDPDAFAVAERIGFSGIQVMLGKSTGPNQLVLSDPKLQQRIWDHRSTITWRLLARIWTFCTGTVFNPMILRRHGFVNQFGPC
jgi:hypothetical protein